MPTNTAVQGRQGSPAAAESDTMCPLGICGTSRGATLVQKKIILEHIQQRFRRIILELRELTYQEMLRSLNFASPLPREPQRRPHFYRQALCQGQLSYRLSPLKNGF